MIPWLTVIRTDHSLWLEDRRIVQAGRIHAKRRRETVGGLEDR